MNVFYYGPDKITPFPQKGFKVNKYKRPSRWIIAGTKSTVVLIVPIYIFSCCRSVLHHSQHRSSLHCMVELGIPNLS